VLFSHLIQGKNKMLEELKYPIGKFVAPEKYTTTILSGFVKSIETLPERLKKEVLHLNNEQLNTPYRENGWTIIQVVTHLADSHINALIRVKFALTEVSPKIMPYKEQLWAELPDSNIQSLVPALQILEGVHARWTILLNSLKEHEWNKAYFHPEKAKLVTLQESTASYAWHGNHHLAHIAGVKRRINWK